jgi:hypothetical protein
MTSRRRDERVSPTRVVERARGGGRGLDPRLPVAASTPKRYFCKLAKQPTMRPLSLAAALALLVVPCTARGAETDSGLALLTAGGIDALGFIVGGALLGASGGRSELNNAGWLTIEAGFTLSPLVAHGVAGEWGRGAVFAAPPALALAGTATLFEARADEIEHGSLPTQRWLWGLFSGALIASTVGAVDVLFAASRERARSIAVQPTIGPGQLGLHVEGDL